MKREDILLDKGYWISKIQLDLYSQLEDYMKIHKFNRSQLAKKLNVTKGYITQVLNGDFNHRISKFVELSLAIEKVPQIHFVDLNELIQQDKDGYYASIWRVSKKKSELENEAFESYKDVKNMATIKEDSNIDLDLLSIA